MSLLNLNPAPVDAPWRAGVESARRLAWPGMVLVAAAAAVVAAYYHVEPVHAALEHLARWRTQGGVAFSALFTATFAGVIPFLYLRLHPHTALRHPWPHVVFFAAFWAYKGIEIDAVYRLQAVVFGDDARTATVVKKLIFDQFIYNPFFAAPIAVLIYAWKDAGFHWAGPRADLQAPRWYGRRVLPALIGVWAVWVPAVSCIYALPLALQLPLCALVNCFWVVLFSLITTRNIGR